MKHKILQCVTLIAVAVTAPTTLQAQAPNSNAQASIATSLSKNGILIWTNSITNGLYTIQWASSLSATNTIWLNSWDTLTQIHANPNCNTTTVPMFYRVQYQAATVRLGDAFFNDSSDQIPTNSILAIPTKSIKFDGFGNYADYSQTNRYSTGDTVLGVKTIKQEVTKNQSGYWTNTTYWWALDILGNQRILKVTHDGANTYLASITNTPTISKPASLSVGTTWNAFGAWNTLISTNATYGDYTNLIEYQWVSGFDVDFEYFQVGVGKIVDYWYTDPDSGWQRRSE